MDHIWDKVFKSELSKFCGRQPLKNLNFFKGCLPLNLLSSLCLIFGTKSNKKKPLLKLLRGVNIK